MKSNDLSGPGIVVAASGSHRYLSQAIALAASVKLNSPGTPVGLITDLSLEEWERRLFDVVRGFDFSANPALGYRFHFDELAVFEEGSLFVDSDTLCYRDLNPFLKSLACYEVASFCYPEQVHAHWFVDKGRSVELNRVFPFPGLSGDVHFVKPGAVADEFFANAREISRRYDELGMARWRGGMNDEPVFAMAYWEGRMSCPARDDSILGQATSSRCRSFRTDCLNGFIEAEYLDGRRLHPLLFHFEMYANRPSYQWEVAHLLASARGGVLLLRIFQIIQHFLIYFWERRNKLMRKVFRYTGYVRNLF